MSRELIPESHDTILLAFSKDNNKLVFCKTYDHTTQKSDWLSDMEMIEAENIWWKIGQVEGNYFINKDEAERFGGQELLTKLTELEKL